MEFFRDMDVFLATAFEASIKLGSVISLMSESGRVAVGHGGFEEVDQGGGAFSFGFRDTPSLEVFVYVFRSYCFNESPKADSSGYVFEVCWSGWPSVRI